MIVLDSVVYKEKMGKDWRPGMILEAAKVMQWKYQQFFPKADDLEKGIKQFVEDTGWNPDHVLVVYGVPKNIPDEEVKLIYDTLLERGMEPSMAFLAPQIQSVDDLIRLTTKLANLRAFL